MNGDGGHGGRPGCRLHDVLLPATTSPSCCRPAAPHTDNHSVRTCCLPNLLMPARLETPGRAEALGDPSARGATTTSSPPGAAPCKVRCTSVPPLLVSSLCMRAPSRFWIADYFLHCSDCDFACGFLARCCSITQRVAGCREELLDPPDLVSTTAVACSMFRGKAIRPLGFSR
jgi:hypothetical protein